MTVLGQFPDFLIRTFQPGDAASLSVSANDPRVAETLRDRFPQPYDTQRAEGWIEFVQSQTPTCNFALADAAGVFGGIGLEPLDDVSSHCAEVGYWITPAFWNQQVATRALIWFTGHAFETLRFARLFAYVFSSNPASARVLEKAGYVREGTLRASVIKHDQVLDQWLYAALADEWSPPRAPHL